MKIFCPVLLLIFSFQLMAAQITVSDPCSEEKWIQEMISPSIGRSIGEITVAVLEKNQIPFLGDEKGIRSIQNTVIGDEAIEIISNSEIKIYGWCFRLNGKLSEKYIHEIFSEKETDQIEWFFSYAHYLDGQWKAYCVPTSENKPNKICSSH